MKKILFIGMACSLFMTSFASTNSNEASQSSNSIQLVRNATLKIHYAGYTFLVDPMLCQKGSFWSFMGVNKNPRVYLTMPIDSIMSNVDFTLVSHSHPDHFDQSAIDVLSKNKMKIYTQPADLKAVSEAYKLKDNVAIVNDSIQIGNLTIIRTGGSHGLGESGKRCGTVSGFVLKAPDCPVVYIAGDVIWNDEIKNNIKRFNPDYIVSNSGGAIFVESSATEGPLIMDERQTVEMIKNTTDKCKVIAVHMEALDHCQTTRSVLRSEADHAGISHDKLIIPNDGEIIPLK